MPDIEVRDFQGGDLEEVARVWRASWISTGLTTGSDPVLSEYQDRLASEDWLILVAVTGSDIVGFLAFNRQKSWLRQLFVGPAMQRTGVGTMLLDTARREMPEGFWLRTDADNHHARRFYERRGLRADG